MTDSSTDTKSSDRGFDVGPSTDELFGEIAEDSLEEATTDRGDDVGDGNGNDADDGITDRTATDVFDQLQADAGGHDADGVLADESPDDIIASADEPEPEPDRPEAADVPGLVDEDALEELLLTERTKDQEFLWVDAGDTRDESDDEGTTGEAESDAAAETNADGSDSSDDRPETAETALTLRDEETDLATTDDSSSTGVLGWVRSVLGRLF